MAAWRARMARAWTSSPSPSGMPRSAVCGPLDAAADRGQRAGERVGQRSGQPLIAVGEEGRRQDGPRIGHAGDRVAGLGQDAPQQPGQVREPPGPDLDAGGGRDDVVDHMGLVDDREVVLGEDGAVAGEVEAVQVEVDDDHVGLGGPVAGGLGEAAVAPGAPGRPGAVARRRADRRPCGVAGLDVELGAVAGDRGGRPRGDGGELLGVGPLGQPVERQLAGGRRRRGPVGRRTVGRRTGRARGHLGQALHAHVVRPALEDGPRERVPERLLEERQVLGRELVLEGTGGGGDDGALAAEHGRHEVAERLAGAGAGPHHEVPAGGDGVGDRPCHLVLPVPDLAPAGQLGHHRGQSGGRIGGRHGRRR